jgi:small subunit ribosomal protein S6
VRNYEVVFIAAPTLTSEELDAFINHAQTVIEGKNGKIVKVDNWGRKSLAYKINKFREGYYVVLSIEAEGGAIAELERRFRVTDFIIRFISVRIDENIKRSEKIKAARRRKAPHQSADMPYISEDDESDQESGEDYTDEENGED